jgi:hypothetical protein
MVNIEDNIIYRQLYTLLDSMVVSDNVINKLLIKEHIEEFAKFDIFKISLSSEEKLHIYDSLIDKFEYEINKNSIEVTQGITLSDPKRHNPWTPEKGGFYWGIHKTFISNIYKKKDPDHWKEIIKSIDGETDSLLSLIEDPNREEFDSKGLVIGYVQSGKTANFTALISKAMDAGYKMIVVLAGMHNSLRQQTQARLDKELFGYDDYHNQSDNILNSYMHDGELNRDRRPKRVTKTAYIDASDEAISDGEFNQQIEKLSDLLNHRDKYNKVVAVIKKNVTVLKKINAWIERCPKEIRDRTPILIIDDEADQASIDGNYLKNVRQGKNIEDNVTETNNQILIMLDSFIKSSFIGYTATPLANCFIHPDFKGLYPHNFIHFLPKPPSYFGAEKIFGSDEIKKCYTVTENIETKQIAGNQINLGELPESLNRAIYNFLISFGVRLLRGEINKPMAMLVHIDHLVLTQKTTYELINQRLDVINSVINQNTEQSRSLILELEEEYNFNKEKSEVLCHKENISRNMFTFPDVLEQIKLYFNKIEVKQVHSRSEDELNYVKQPDLKVIAIGGNKLSRGLTLEGLMTTYFLRNTDLADTLMQMGRFFGYRGGYSDLMKIFCHEKILDNFTYLIDVENDLRDEVSRYKIEGKTPVDFAPTVRAHISMKPTGKMGNSQRFKHTYGSSSVQTTYFDLQNINILKYNYDLMTQFVNQLNEDYKLDDPKFKKTSGKVFYNVKLEDILSFLNNFKVVENDLSIKDIINYLTDKGLNLINVGVPSLSGNSKKTSFGNIGDFSLVNRSRLDKTFKNGTYNIKALTAPLDWFMDLDNGVEDDFKRDSPLLLLYRIDKNSKNERNSKVRLDLFEGIENKTDVAGIAIKFPSPNSDEYDVIGQKFY